MKKGVSRIRQHGTLEVVSESWQDKIQAIQSIKDRWQYAKVDGFMIDAFTANLILAVYEALSEKNKIKYATMPIKKMVEIAYKLTRR